MEISEENIKQHIIDGLIHHGNKLSDYVLLEGDVEEIIAALGGRIRELETGIAKSLDVLNM